jgi:hypothetical protein
VLLGKGAYQRILDEIISPACIPQERPRITPKGWDFCFEKRAKIGHHYSTPMLLNRWLNASQLGIAGLFS